MDEYLYMAKCFQDFSDQCRVFDTAVKKLVSYQEEIVKTNTKMEQFVYSVGVGKELLACPNHEEVMIVEKPEAVSADEALSSKHPEQTNSGSSSISKSLGRPMLKPELAQSRVSQKRPKEESFTLEKRKNDIPKRISTSGDIAKMEKILKYIASKKLTGVSSIREIATICNCTIMKSNEYLSALMKLEEIVSIKTQSGFTYQLHPDRYYKYLNSK